MAKQELDTILGAGASLQGDLTVKGGARVDGRLKGNLRVDGHLVVGKTGVVDGEIRAHSVLVAGTVKGKVVVQERAEFEGGARFQGDLECKRLVVHDGVIFDGTCSMTGGNRAAEKR